MGGLDISFETVRQKSGKLNGQIRNRLEKETIEGYEKLESSIQQSGGNAVESIVEDLRQEKRMLTEMKLFMIKLLELMEKSTDAFEETDVRYRESIRKLGQEG